MGIEIEGFHTETGPGVYETAIRYSDALRAADQAALFKTVVKILAQKHGLVATFMAKWNSNLPGCSGHIHQSLADAQGRRISSMRRESRLADVRPDAALHGGTTRLDARVCRDVPAHGEFLQAHRAGHLGADQRHLGHG